MCMTSMIAETGGEMQGAGSDARCLCAHRAVGRFRSGSVKIGEGLELFRFASGSQFAAMQVPQAGQAAFDFMQPVKLLWREVLFSCQSEQIESLGCKAVNLLHCLVHECTSFLYMNV